MALSKAAVAKRKRMWVVAIAGLLLVAAVALVTSAFRDSIVFYSPSEVADRIDDPALKLAERRFRLGGLVEEGSIQKLEGGKVTEFTVTDGAGTVRVRYAGLLPDLFREGQGVVAEGKLDDGGLFVASDVLAKHDENYMPKEVADALKKSGYWQQDEVGTTAQ